MAYLENFRLVAVFAYLDMLKLEGILCNEENTLKRCIIKISQHRELIKPLSGVCTLYMDSFFVWIMLLKTCNPV